MGHSTVFGRYQLIAELGHGGMADVFLAVQAGPAGSGFRKLTVIKRLRKNLADEPEFVTMLVDEARIAARLNHPNVVQTNEVGEIDGQYFIAMEYLDGQAFHRIQHRSSAKAKETGVELCTKEQQYLILMDTLAGLHHAHELADFDGTPLEVVHRDVTPHNIFVTYDGQVKVVDFGIAKAVGRAAETRQGVVKGKIRYMAPEQALGKELDRRADVFPVGVMLWQVATGKRLWGDVDELAVVQALIAGSFPASPRSVDPTVPEAIDAICRKALAVRPEDRYVTADEFRAALEEYLGESGQLVKARKGLQSALNELFADKRKAIRTVIEQQLAALDVRVESNSGEYASLIDSSSASVASLSGSNAPRVNRSATALLPRPSAVPVVSETPNGTAAPYVQQPPPTSSTRRGVVTLLAAGALFAAAAGLAFVGYSRARAQEAVAKPAETEKMTLKVTAAAPNARVFVDADPPVGAPLERVVPRDGKEHRIRVEAEGHVGKTDTVVYAEDLTMNVELAKLPETTAATTVKTATPPVQQNGGGGGWRPRTPTSQAKDPTPPPPETTTAVVQPSSTTPPKRSGKFSLDSTDPWQDAGK